MKQKFKNKKKPGEQSPGSFLKKEVATLGKKETFSERILKEVEAELESGVTPENIQNILFVDQYANATGIVRIDKKGKKHLKITYEEVIVC